MGIKRKTFLLVLMVCSSQRSPASSSQPCAKFTFSTLTNNTLTAAVHSHISLRFQLQQHNCTAGNFVLTVAKRDSNTGRLAYHCKLLHKDGKCDALTQQERCHCLKEPGQYQLTKTAELTDSGTWVWKIEEEEETTVTFQITEPPSITRLTLAGNEDRLPRPASPNSKIDVVCTWDAGTPPVAAHLLDRHGAILHTDSDVTGEIRYRFAAVGCQDAGLIRCQAPGAVQNKTATLLVTCPPMFAPTNHMFIARNKEATFPVRMHTKDIISCKLTRNTSENNRHKTSSERSMDCLSLITVTGCPPDLTVSVRLDNVSKQDQGTWRLTLTNDMGSGQMDVFFHTTDDQTLPIMSTQDHPTFPSSASWVTAGAAVVAAVAVVVYVVILACRRHRQEGTKHRLPASRRAAYYSYIRSSFESLPLTPRILCSDTCSIQFPPTERVRNDDLLASRRLARSEECVVINNVLYQRSSRLLEIPEEDAGCSGLSKFNVDNRPPAPLPIELYGQEEGDYSEAGERPKEAKDTKFTASEHDYVPIKDILERKRQAKYHGPVVHGTRL